MERNSPNIQSLFLNYGWLGRSGGDGLSLRMSSMTRRLLRMHYLKSNQRPVAMNSNLLQAPNTNMVQAELAFEQGETTFDRLPLPFQGFVPWQSHLLGLLGQQFLVFRGNINVSLLHIKRGTGECRTRS